MSEAVSDRPKATTQPRYRFSVEQYDRMGQTGILTDERVELIDGEIITLSPIGNRHAAGVKSGNAFFSRRLADGAIVSVQDPIVLGDMSEPQPDLVLLRPRADFYRSAHPRPDDVLLIVEIVDSSIAYDRDVKARLYARHGISETWIADIDQDAIVVCREPAATGYRSIQLIRRGQTVAPLAFPDRMVSVADLLG